MSVRLEQRAKGVALVNGCCVMPHGYIVNGKLRLQSVHDRKAHVVELSAEELRQIADEIDCQNLSIETASLSPTFTNIRTSVSFTS